MRAGVAIVVLNRFTSRQVTILLAVISCPVSLRCIHRRAADTIEPDHRRDLGPRGAHRRAAYSTGPANSYAA